MVFLDAVFSRDTIMWMIHLAFSLRTQLRRYGRCIAITRCISPCSSSSIARSPIVSLHYARCFIVMNALPSPKQCNQTSPKRDNRLRFRVIWCQFGEYFALPRAIFTHRSRVASGSIYVHGVGILNCAWAPPNASPSPHYPD